MLLENFERGEGWLVCCEIQAFVVRVRTIDDSRRQPVHLSEFCGIDVHVS